MITLGLISRQKAYTIGEVFLGDVCLCVEVLREETIFYGGVYNVCMF